MFTIFTIIHCIYVHICRFITCIIVVAVVYFHFFFLWRQIKPTNRLPFMLFCFGCLFNHSLCGILLCFLCLHASLFYYHSGSSCILALNVYGQKCVILFVDFLLNQNKIKAFWGRMAFSCLMISSLHCVTLCWRSLMTSNFIFIVINAFDHLPSFFLWIVSL